MSFTIANCQNAEYVDKKGNTHLIGKCTKAAFEKETYKEWFDKSYNNYEVNTDLLQQVKRKTKGITFEIFMATWCGDSKREVPRFMKILDELKVKESAISIINVNNSKESYKQSPTHEEEGKLIFRVPTFIIYKKGVEIGRIVEYPVTSLEMDLVQILLGLPTSPNYNAIHQLEDLFAKNGIPNDRKSYLEHARSIWKVSKKSSELNSYGYILLGKNEIDKAIAVFYINAILYKKEANVYDSLAEAYEEKGEKELALKMYQKAVEINPKSEHAVERIAELSK